MNDLNFSCRAENDAAKAANYSVFGKLNLAHIRSEVEAILKLIGRDGIFDEYTLHDMSHIDEMLNLLEWVVPEETSRIMTPTDWLLIVLACYFHDMGLLVTRREYEMRGSSGFPKFRDEVLLSGDRGVDYKAKLAGLTDDQRERFYYQEFVRHHHPERIFHWINGHAADELGITHQSINVINSLLDGLQTKLREDLALICRSHHSSDLDQLSTYVIRRAYGQETETHANVHYSALLLRTVDLLHMRNNRVPSVMFKLIDPANPKSQEEWAKQAGVRAVLPKLGEESTTGLADTVEVQADFNEASGFFGLSAYLDYVRSQLKISAQWGQLAQNAGSKYQFPWRDVDSSQVEARGFLKKQFKFELDRSRILELLTGHTLYNDSLVAIREILQNSLDAVRFYHHTHSDEPIGEVAIEWNSKNRQLVIRDNGTGMTQQIIEEHLLNVGSSYYQSAKVREQYSSFASISRFGIGVLSIFMISDEIEFLTVHPEEEFARTLTLPSVQHRYLIKTLSKDHEKVKIVGSHGTQVTLTVRASANIEDIVEIVKYWIVIPKCRVSVKVDDSAPVEIGFSDVKSALEYYVSHNVPAPTGSRKIKTLMEEIGNVELAYSVQYSPYLDSWDFLPRDADRLTRTMSIASRRMNYVTVPGICIEGIRVDYRSPGFSHKGPWALANITGIGAPRTNVARSDLEQNEELENSMSSVYKMLVGHSLTEFKRLNDSGASLLKASREADYIWSYGLDLYPKIYPAIFDNCVDEIPVVVIEDQNTCKPVSRKSIHELGSIWTVDSPLIEHVEGLAQALNVTLPAEQVIERLTESKPQNLPFPRLLGRSIKPLSGLEITNIHLDRANQRIDFCWGIGSKRWLNLGKLIQSLGRASRIDMDDDDYELDYVLNRQSDLSRYWMAVGDDIKYHCPDTDMIEWRGRIYVLPSSPITLLHNIFGMDERFAQWTQILLKNRKIPTDKALLLHQNLVDAGKSPDDILPKLVISSERTFGINYFKRNNQSE